MVVDVVVLLDPIPLVDPVAPVVVDKVVLVDCQLPSFPLHQNLELQTLVGVVVEWQIVVTTLHQMVAQV